MNHCLGLELPDTEDRKEGDREDHILGKGQMSPLKDVLGRKEAKMDQADGMECGMFRGGRRRVDSIISRECLPLTGARSFRAGTKGDSCASCPPFREP